MDETPDTTHDHPTDHAPTRPTRRKILGSRFAAPALALAVLLGAAAAVTVTAGGDDRSSSSGGPAGDRTDRTPQEDAALAFAGCMRDNGIEDFPDPEIDQEGGISIGDALGDQRDTAAFQDAEDACEPLLADTAPAPPGPELPPDQVAELQDQWLAVAACVRAEGHAIDDPHVDEYGRPEIRVESQDVEQALEECVQDSDLARPLGPAIGL